MKSGTQEVLCPSMCPRDHDSEMDGSLEIKSQRRGQHLVPKAGEMSRRGPSGSNHVIGSLESGAEAQGKRIRSRSRKDAGRSVWDVLGPGQQSSHKKGTRRQTSAECRRNKRAWRRGQKSL